MKFTLRDLFWLTLVAGLSVGWSLDHRWETLEIPPANVAATIPSNPICAPPTNVLGVVVAVSTTDQVEVSIGSDDGLKVGHQLQVARGNQYLGHITIRAVGPDRAVGQIDKQRQRGKIQTSDSISLAAGSKPVGR